MKKKFSEFETKLQEKDFANQKLQKSNETLQKEYDKLLSDKLTSDVQNTQIGKIYEAIDADPELKAIVAYSIKSKDDDSYKQKLGAAVQEYLRKVAGIDVDELKKTLGNSAKNSLGADGSDINPGGGDS